MDLDNLGHNTRDGTAHRLTGGHLDRPGRWTGGMRHHNDGVLAFEPRLPEGIVRLAFNPFLRGQRLRVEIAHDSARYSVTDGVPLIIKHHRQPARVTAGEPLELPIPPTVVRPAPTQQSGRAPAHRRGTGHNS